MAGLMCMMMVMAVIIVDVSRGMLWGFQKELQKCHRVDPRVGGCDIAFLERVLSHRDCHILSSVENSLFIA